MRSRVLRLLRVNSELLALFNKQKGEYIIIGAAARIIAALSSFNNHGLTTVMVVLWLPHENNYP